MHFLAQCTDTILRLLEEHNIDTVFVPPNCTDQLQPLDLSLNKPVKDFMRSKFKNANEVLSSYKGDSSTIKPMKFPSRLPYTNSINLIC